MDKYTNLRTMEAHLRGGKLGVSQFNFRFIHQPIGCGTCGCAVGEMPVLWPDKFVLTKDNINKLVDGKPEMLPWPEIGEFFGISEDAVVHLFVPNCQDVEEFGGKDLDGESTALDVADQINALIDKRNGL